MAPMFKTNRGIFSGLALITVLVIVTVIGFAAFLNDRCQRGFWDALVVYPGAERVEEQSAFMGVQRVTYHSPDAPAVIEQWYTAQNASHMREAVLSGDFSETASKNWLIESDAQGGSTITLAAICPSGSPTF